MGNQKLIYFSLFIGTLLIRIYFIDQDNYLHDWDEKYHALVAKNLIESPLIPQLRKDPVLEYRYQDWWGQSYLASQAAIIFYGKWLFQCECLE
jgi:hypothetical protein